ncbi:cell division protein CrgA [Boudabousia marimammalium]|uniref:Cell division protein CrgA n=1 Tax=Boudabousia marimammalium TaxID=156892 RepID=A0A1Q5PSJ7_9ACTO|nr:cell division protein CrgA [Boudabousia marimammalium]OKL50551.1 septation inhibitor protein [Boudabousia marimammalium]
MPESRKRKKNGKSVSQIAEKKTEIKPDWTEGIKPSPSWWAPVFCTLAIIGLIWLAIYYMWSAQYPIPGIGHWNMGIGLGFIFAGFLMVMRWR